jgi:hypothetical protein
LDFVICLQKNFCPSDLKLVTLEIDDIEEKKDEVNIEEIKVE